MFDELSLAMSPDDAADVRGMFYAAGLRHELAREERGPKKCPRITVIKIIAADRPAYREILRDFYLSKES